MDLQGFSTPQQQYEGLYRISDDMRQDSYRKEQQAYQREQAVANRRDANDKYFTNLLNPKDYLTGTHYDPNTIQLLQEATRKAYDLSAKGADMNAITMAIGPLVSKVADYSSKAKMYQDQKKQILEKFKGVKGYDMDAMNRLLDEETFYRVNPQTGQRELDVDNADASLRTPLQKILSSRLHEVTTNEGFMDWAKDMPMEEYDDNVLTTDPKGNKTRAQLRTKRSGWEVAESDGKGGYRFVPRYEEATDGGAPLQHDFTGPDGKPVKATVRLLDKNIFQNLLASKPGAADYIKGQVARHIGEYKDENGNPIDLSHPKAEMVARAIAYDYLKPLTRGVIASRKEQTLSPQQIRINLTGSPYAPQRSSDSGSGDVTINDVYSTIDSMATERRDQKARGLHKGYLQINLLDNDAQNVVLAEARKLTGNSQLGQDEIKIVKEGDKLAIRYHGDGDTLIGYLTKKGVNTKAQPSVKEKRAVIQQGNQSPQPAHPAKKKVYKGLDKNGNPIFE
jgi:hypothetical protein